MATKGLAEVTRNLNREIAGIEGRSRDGLHLAGLFVQSEAIPITPHSGQAGGTLRNSAFTDTTAKSVRPIVTRVGFTALYAAFVHEMPASFNFTSPGTGPKFLQKAISRNTREILNIIRQRAKLPSGGA